jgi:hypothetical protein
LSAARRLSEAEAAEVLARAQAIPANRGASPTLLRPVPASGLDGRDASIDPPVAHRLLLVFVSLSCDGCRQLFEVASEPGAFGLGGQDELAFVARDEEDADALAALVGPATGLLSSAAFSAYRVSGPPFFVLLDAAFSSVATEGVAWGVEPIRSAVAAARGGDPGLEVPRLDVEQQ